MSAFNSDEPQVDITYLTKEEVAAKLIPFERSNKESLQMTIGDLPSLSLRI